MRTGTVLLAACLISVPSIALAARHCVSGIVYQETQPQPGAHVKLVSDQREVSTFAKANGAYSICAADGTYTLEVTIGGTVYVANAFRIERDDTRNIDVARMEKKTGGR